MSSRALRKLHGSTDIVIPASVRDSAGDHGDGEDEVSDDIDDQLEPCKRRNRKKKRNNYSNPFDLVCDNGYIL